MEKSIFENAKFGDRYRTRDGRMALFVCKANNQLYPLRFVIDGCSVVAKTTENGRWYSDSTEDYRDIVGRWKEPIDEEALDKLAEEANYIYSIDVRPIDVKSLHIGFKAGYRKAKEE